MRNMQRTNPCPIYALVQNIKALKLASLCTCAIQEKRWQRCRLTTKILYASPREIVSCPDQQGSLLVRFGLQPLEAWLLFAALCALPVYVLQESRTTQSRQLPWDGFIKQEQHRVEFQTLFVGLLTFTNSYHINNMCMKNSRAILVRIIRNM